MATQGKKKNNWIKILIIVYIAAIAFLVAKLYWIPKFSTMLTDKYTAEFGTLTAGVETEYLVVRNEKVYLSDKSGSTKRNVEQGEIQRSKTNIVTIGSENVASKERGVISFYSDGFEEKFTPDIMTTLKSSAIRIYNESNKATDSDVYYSPLKETSTGYVDCGEPIFKTVDNQEWYIIVWLEKNDANRYTKGKTVSIKLEDETTLSTKVYEKTEQGTLTQIVLSCNRYYENFDKVRTGKGTLIENEKSGIILETQSIVTIDGKQGVYVINKLGEKVFTPVKILTTNGEKTAVEKNYYYDADGNYIATVKIYDTIFRVDVEDMNEGENNVN